MPHTLLRNPGLEPYTLLWPLAGTLMPGQARTFPVALADFISLAGTDLAAYLSAAKSSVAVDAIPAPSVGDLAADALDLDSNGLYNPGSIVQQNTTANAPKVITALGRVVDADGADVAGEAGVGVRLDFSANNDGGTPSVAGRITTTLTDVTEGSEDGSMSFGVNVNGTVVTRAQLNATGIGFFAATPVAQAAHTAALGAFTDPPSAGEMATLRTTVNAFRTLLINYGLMAAS